MLQHAKSIVLCVLFLSFVFLLAPRIFESTSRGFATFSLSSSIKFPDFSQYVDRRTIDEDELSVEHRRVIIVGDIHGMKPSFDKLLDALSYTPSDLLIHLGDTIVKGSDSLSVLQQFTSTDVAGVRGNHEQKVIEWRGWIEWVESQRGGKEWLEELEGMKSPKFKKWKWPVPKGWKFMGKHYKVARSLTTAQYSYLKSLPLVIHLPSLHTHLVHAGILPFDPRISPTSSDQPLAHTPKHKSPPSTGQVRAAQEVALLKDVAQNTDPWVLLNMRSISQNNKVSSKSKGGVPWSDLWDMTMKRCKGYRRNVLVDDDAISSGLSCLPINVVYGHAASRGLDIKRWSFGLDTGCVYGRRLTAMVIGNSTAATTAADAQTQQVSFGEHGTAQLFSIPCSS